MKPAVAPFGNADVSLRLLQSDDLALTLAWRNRDDARIWFKNADRISPSQHQDWFLSYSNKAHDLVFIVEAQGVAVGQASVYDINPTSACAEIGRFLVAPEQVGKKYIKSACGEIIRFSFEQLNLRYLYLYVLEKNLPAMHIYAHHGFREEHRENGIVKMGLRC